MNKIFGICILSVVFADGIFGGIEEGSHLLTMKKEEFMKIVSCVNDAKVPELCMKMEECCEMRPELAVKAFKKCLGMFPNEGPERCLKGENPFTSNEIPSKVFDCINEEVPEWNDEDLKQIEAFEACARTLHAETCKLPEYQY